MGKWNNDILKPLLKFSRWVRLPVAKSYGTFIKKDGQRPLSAYLWETKHKEISLAEESTNPSITNHKMSHWLIVRQLMQAARRTWKQSWSAVRCSHSTNRNFPFLEKRDIQVFPKMTTIALCFFLLLAPRTLAPLVSRWRPIHSPLVPRVQRSKKNRGLWTVTKGIPLITNVKYNSRDLKSQNFYFFILQQSLFVLVSTK